MAETFRSDGKAVDVTATGAIVKGDVVLEDGFYGVAMADAEIGEEVALEIALREHEIAVGAVSASKGDILYITSGGVITATATGNFPLCKVTVAKDANDLVWAVLLPQGGASA